MSMQLNRRHGLKSDCGSILMTEKLEIYTELHETRTANTKDSISLTCSCSLRAICVLLDRSGSLSNTIKSFIFKRSHCWLVRK